MADCVAVIDSTMTCVKENMFSPMFEPIVLFLPHIRRGTIDSLFLEPVSKLF